MSTLALPFWPRLAWPTARNVAQTRTAPAPKRRSEPVFIHDAITPCSGETLLSIMLRRDLARLGETDPRD